MSATKTSKITACTFNNVWSPPSGGQLYIHSLSFENGDMGKIYAKTQNDPEIAVGKTITYTINEKLQIKIVDAVAPAPTTDAGKKPFVSPKQADIIGLSFSYAKDLMVASMGQGKKYANIPDEFIKIAMPIYNKMTELKESLKESVEKPV